MNIFDIFTKEYREETAYREVVRKNARRPEFKLKCRDVESVDQKVERLRKSPLAN